MRIHTFENKLSIDEFFSAINSKIEPSFEIDENSYTDESNLLIIGINEKDQSVIIRGSIDKSKNRFYLSISAIHNNVILKEQNTLKNINAFPKELGKILFDIIKNSKEEIREGSCNHGYCTEGFPAGSQVDVLYDKDAIWPKLELIDKINSNLHIINHLGHASTNYVFWSISCRTTYICRNTWKNPIRVKNQ